MVARDGTKLRFDNMLRSTRPTGRPFSRPAGPPVRKQETQYFIALLPPDDIQREVTDFKHYIASTWGPRYALKSPPHITLHPPFAWPERNLSALSQSLREFAGRQASFAVQLEHFGSFPPRVVFIQPLENPAMAAMAEKLLKHLESNLNFVDERHHHPFHPHVTIAHRDVDERAFPQIWRYFRQQVYERSFVAKEMALLESVQGRWLVKERFGLGG